MKMGGVWRVILLLLLSVSLLVAADLVEKNVENYRQRRNLIHTGMEMPCPIAALPPDCPKPKDCFEIMELGYVESGVYTVYVGPFDEPVEVYCDQKTDGGGWLVFQRRRDGFENFYRGWNDYANGFGRLYGEFWLGNHFLNLITQQKVYKLRVELEDFENDTRLAEYTNFTVGAAHLKYPLTVGDYNGTAGDSLRYQNGMKFSTRNQNNDQHGCAITYKGAWWYNHCHNSNLNGKYLGGAHTSYADGVIWYHWKGHHYSLKTTEMKMRPNERR